MKTQYDIRNPMLTGSFISFDHLPDALEWYRDNAKNAAPTCIFSGAVVVRHTWETPQEAETARLDFLLSESGIAKFARECLQIDHTPEEWLRAARTAIDIARKSPPDTATVIWPKDDSAAVIGH